jgi:hypothetical protein
MAKGGGRKRKPAPRAKPLSPAYAKRLERAIAKGKTRQEARGHRPGEAKRRREWQTETYGLSKSEMERIKVWRAKVPASIYEPGFPDEDTMVDYFRQTGYDAFKTYRTIWNAARKQYLEDKANGTYIQQSIVYLEVLTDRAEAPELSWLYYH